MWTCSSSHCYHKNQFSDCLKSRLIVGRKNNSQIVVEEISNWHKVITDHWSGSACEPRLVVLDSHRRGDLTAQSLVWVRSVSLILIIIFIFLFFAQTSPSILNPSTLPILIHFLLHVRFMHMYPRTHIHFPEPVGWHLSDTPKFPKFSSHPWLRADNLRLQGKRCAEPPRGFQVQNRDGSDSVITLPYLHATSFFFFMHSFHKHDLLPFKWNKLHTVPSFLSPFISREDSPLKTNSKQRNSAAHQGVVLGFHI